MATAKFIKDGSILWLQVPLVGTPDAWEPGKNYKIGDTVVPTAPISGLEDSMFMCVGFLGRSAGSQPVFPTVVNNEVIDNNIVWTARFVNAAPVVEYEKHQFVVIDEQVTVS